jgi:hypothetical protein
MEGSSMTFFLKADCEFEAENINDAFYRLALHFSKLTDGEESELIEQGEIEIKPSKEAE